jgi:hypothetical protein
MRGRIEMNAKRWMPLAGGALLLVSAAFLMPRAPQPIRSEAAAPPPQPAPVLPPPAPPAVAARAASAVSLQESYRNFRAAVAVGNTSLQDAFMKVLSRDRDQTLGLAQKDWEGSRSPADREISARALDLIRRSR